MDAYAVERGTVAVHPVTFQPLLPVTIYLPLETILDARGGYCISKDELAVIIGSKIINSLLTTHKLTHNI